MNANDMLAKLAELKAQHAQREQAAKAKADMKAALLAQKTAGSERDKFNTRPDSGCGRMHVALATAYAEGMCLTVKDMIGLTGYANVPNHIRTLVSVKQLAERRPTGYTLSPLGAALWHGDGQAFGFATMTPEAETPPAPPAAAAPLESPAEANVGETAGSEQTPTKKGRKAKGA